MRITSVIEYNGEPAIRITDTPTTEALYRTRIKAFCTGVTLEGLKSAIHDESGDIIGITRFFDVNEQVAYIAEPVRPGDVEAWSTSPRSISFLDFLASRDSEGPAPETDNTPVEDQDHEQDHQDHEPEPEPDVGQNELETGQNDCECVVTRELTDLQRSVMRCLSMEDCSVADIAEAMGRTTNSDKVQIRKTCHDLVDMGLAVFLMDLPGIPLEEQMELHDRFEVLWDARRAQVKRSVRYAGKAYDVTKKEVDE